MSDASQSSARSTWPGLTDAAHSQWYIGRFREMAGRGDDIWGEARLVDVLAPRRARLLDAGCGMGRHGGYLAGLGHGVVGVDIDPLLIEAARAAHPEVTWLVGDLAALDLAALGQPEPFDGALLAGNVLQFVPDDARGEVIGRIAAHLRPDGFLVIGCRTDHGVTAPVVDSALQGAGLALEQRFATWDLRPWRDDADFCVTIARRGAV